MGYDGEGELCSAERFDPAAGRWEVLRCMPTARGRCASAAIAGHIYAVGGADDTGVELSAFERYDPGSGLWEVLPPLPTARCGCAAAVAAGCLFVVGGRGGGEKLNKIERFDLTRGL